MTSIEAGRKFWGIARRCAADLCQSVNWSVCQPTSCGVAACATADGDGDGEQS